MRAHARAWWRREPLLEVFPQPLHKEENLWKNSTSKAAGVGRTGAVSVHLAGYRVLSSMLGETLFGLGSLALSLMFALYYCQDSLLYFPQVRRAWCRLIAL